MAEPAPAEKRYRIMPCCRITVTNETFETSIDQEVPDIEAAKRLGLKGALEVGMEMVLSGEPLFGAEVTVTDGNSRERFLVTIGNSPLKK